MRAKLLLALASVAFTIAMLEVALSRFAPQRTLSIVLANHAPMYRRTEGWFTELLPGFEGRERAFEGEYDVAIRVNSLGYRQPEFDPKKGNQIRIVAIGDSFTFGHGVEGEEAWPHVLERVRAERTSGPVEVINAGVDGRWVDEYYLELTRRGLALDPDVVVVGFFIGNDIDGEDARNHVWRSVDAQGRPLTIDASNYVVDHGYRVRNPPELRWEYPVIRNSHVAQLLFGAWKGISDRWGPTPVGEDTMYAPVYEPETERAVKTVEDLFVAMAEACRAHGVQFLVVMIPTRKQASAEPHATVDGLDLEKPQRTFAAFFTEHGIPYIDLLPALRAAAATAPVYFRYDAHWTVWGHTAAARAIAERLAGVGGQGSGAGG